MSMIRSRLTYANVMSTIAIFLVLGGGSFAAVSSPDGAGDPSAQEQGTSPDGDDGGGDGSGGEEPGDGNGGGGDGADGGGDGGDGGDGDGDDNDNGTGDDGNPVAQPLGVTTREGSPVSTTSDSVVASASCHSGEQVVGGGVRTEPTEDVHAEPIVVSSAPDGDGWSATVDNGSGMGRVTATAYAVCALQSP